MKKLFPVESRYGNNLSDIALRSALTDLPNVINYSFLERGSDERQYCTRYRSSSVHILWSKFADTLNIILAGMIFLWSRIKV